jgi:hypothetical protein
VFIRITTSYDSHNQLTFNFTNIGVNENFQYYVQWGYSENCIYGPFTTTYTGVFGTTECTPFNVKCNVNKILKSACVNSLKLLDVEGMPVSELNDYICEEIGAYLGIECETGVGGPENIIGDFFCGSEIFAFAGSCANLLSQGEDVIIDEVCNEFQI